MSPVLARILEEAQQLTPEEQSRLIELLRDAMPLRAATSDAAVDHVFGKYADVPNSSERFCARKAEEIELENRRQQQ